MPDPKWLLLVPYFKPSATLDATRSFDSKPAKLNVFLRMNNWCEQECMPQRANEMAITLEKQYNYHLIKKWICVIEL